MSQILVSNIHFEATGNNRIQYDGSNLTFIAQGNVVFTSNGTFGTVNAGVKSSGTFTPDPSLGEFQSAINDGAHTLAPPTRNCKLVIQYTNNTAANTVTTSGFTKVTGDIITLTSGHDFFMNITVCNGFSHLSVQALQ